MDVEFLRYQYENRRDGVITKSRFKIGVRHLQIAYMVACSAAMGAMRGSIGVAIMAVNDATRRNDTYIQIHNWDQKIQGTMLSSFFFGYAILLVPAELVLKKINGKVVTTSILGTNGVLCLTMPTIVNKGGWIATCNALFMMGMTQACLNPASQNLIENWLPPNEKYVCSGFVYGGLQLGVVVSLYVAGILSEARLGWELIFYSLAMTTLSMAIICAVLTAGSPKEHQAVGDGEKEYLKESMSLYKKNANAPVMPWRTVLKTREFWAVTCAHAASSAIFVFYLTKVPVYLNVLNLSIRDCSFYALLAVIAMWVLYATTAPTIDWLTRLGVSLFNLTYFRKLINALGALGAVTGLVILPHLAADWGNMTIIVLVATLGSVGFQFSGFLKNLQDMSENFHGTLLMMTSSIAGLFGAFVPVAAGLIVNEDVNSISRWKAVFLLLASVYAFGNILFTILGSGERQGWDQPGTRQKWGYHNISNQLELEEMTTVPVKQKIEKS